MPQIDPENIENFEVSVVFDSFFVQFPRDLEVLTQSKTKKRAMK